MLDINEKKFLKELFFDQSITKDFLKKREKESKNDEKPFWKTLYNFILTYRTIAIESDDTFIEKWLYEVAPSCSYPRNLDGKRKFCCIFCENQYIRTAYLVRHYKERHVDELPRNIFGHSEEFKCDICNVTYARKENMQIHLQSLKHNLAINPDYKIPEKVNHNKSKRETEISEWESKRPRIKEHYSDSSNESKNDKDENFNQININTELKSVSKNISAQETCFKLGLSDNENEDKDILKNIDENTEYLEEITNFNNAHDSKTASQSNQILETPTMDLNLVCIEHQGKQETETSKQEPFPSIVVVVEETEQIVEPHKEISKACSQNKQIKLSNNETEPEEQVLSQKMLKSLSFNQLE
jgi:hypothetical protein